MSYIVIQKAKNGRVCVHLAENHHVPELGQSRQTRVHIGMLDPDTGELRLSARRPEPDARLLELLAKRGIAYSGRRAPSRGPVPSPSARRPTLRMESNVAWVEEVGEAYVVGILAESSGLDGSLREALGGVDGAAALCLATHHACTGEAQYLAAEWIAGRKLPEALSDFDFSSPALSGFMGALGRSHGCRHAFIRKWVAACGHPESIILDTTSLSTHSDTLDMAEWGHNRDGDRLPQVNFTLAIDAASNLPLAYRTCFGSVPDVATLKATGEFLREYGLRRISYCADKGFWSSANAAAMIAGEMDFVVGVPQTSSQAKSLVRRHRGRLARPGGGILRGGHVCRHARDKWVVDMPDGSSRVLNAFLLMDPERAAGQAADIERKTLELLKIASEKVFGTRRDAHKWLRENARRLACHFRVSSGREGAPRVELRRESVARACHRAGISIYVTNRAELDAESLLRVVRGRDMVEKVFDIVKNEDGDGRLRTGDGDRAEGRLLIAFLTAILHVLLEKRLLKAGLLDKYTVSESFAMLRKIKCVHFESGRRVMVEIPMKVRKLLEAMEIPLPTRA